VTPPLPKQAGLALIEALMASAVLGIGLVGATQLSLKSLQTVRENRQFTVAQHWAQEAMDCMHAQPLNHATACPSPQTRVVQGVPYKLQIYSASAGTGSTTTLSVRVSWPRTGHRASNSTPVGSHSGASSSDENQIEWHSSVSALPSWVGVSLP
jgi:Tfp pilus assembly protein PilV